MNKHIVITGISGFVGTNLSHFLKERGDDIVGISRNPIKNELNYKSLNIDLLNNSKVLIHLAGKAHDLNKTSSYQDYFKVNTNITKNIFNTFLKSSCEVFFYVSSVKAVADEAQEALTENTSPNPVTAYGKSKLAAENYLFSKTFPKNKRIYILRPCMIHGPLNKGNLNLLYKFVSTGIPWPLGAFKNQRSFCSIDNLLFIIHELIENKSILSGIYNVADDIPLSTNEVVKLISKSQKRNQTIWNFPIILIKFLARLGDKINLPLNSESLKKLTESYIVCNKKIIQAIGKKLPIRSEDGMLKTFESYNK